jgi:hypothetical protein
MDERNIGNLKMMLGLGGGKMMEEEFKMHEDEDNDYVDLLDEKKKSKDINEFYA